MLGWRPSVGRRQRPLRHRLYAHRPVFGRRRHLVPTAHLGQGNAAELLLLSERVNAQQALKLGLINRIVALADLEAGTAGLTEHVKDGPLRAYCETKRLLAGSADRTLADQLQAQAGGFACYAATLGFGEGVRAFLERRKPSFPGR